MNDVEHSPFLGRQVKLEVNVHEYNGNPVYTYWVDDPEFVAEVKAMYGEKARVMTQSSISDAAVRLYRVSVRVNNDGIVTRVSRG